MGLPPALAFGVLVVVVAALGFALGLALAPRMMAWDDRRARREAPEGDGQPAAGEAGERDDDGGASGVGQPRGGAVDEIPPSEGGGGGD